MRNTKQGSSGNLAWTSIFDGGIAGWTGSVIGGARGAFPSEPLRPQRAPAPTRTT
jgi:hypothetical protein